MPLLFVLESHLTYLKGELPKLRKKKKRNDKEKKEEGRKPDYGLCL